MGDAPLKHGSTTVDQVCMAWMALHRLNADYTMQVQCGAVAEQKAKVAQHRRSRPGASAKAQADADPRPESGMSSPHACCTHGQQAVPDALILRAATRIVWLPKPAESDFGMQDCVTAQVTTSTPGSGL